jgi:hypothetical protein
LLKAGNRVKMPARHGLNRKISINKHTGQKYGQTNIQTIDGQRDMWTQAYIWTAGQINKTERQTWR